MISPCVRKYTTWICTLVEFVKSTIFEFVSGVHKKTTLAPHLAFTAAAALSLLLVNLLMLIMITFVVLPIRTNSTSGSSTAVVIDYCGAFSAPNSEGIYASETFKKGVKYVLVLLIVQYFLLGLLFAVSIARVFSSTDTIKMK